MNTGDKIKIRVELKDRKGRPLPSILNGVVVDETDLEYKVKTIHGVFSLLKEQPNLSLIQEKEE